MTRTIVQSLLILVLMLSAAVGAVALKPTALLADSRPRIDLEAAIPQQIGEWQADTSAAVMVPSAQKEEAMALIYSQSVSRSYVNSRGQRIMLSMAYGSAQTQQLRAHRQEVCYGAQGFQISGLRTQVLTIGGRAVPATQMVARLGARTEPVTYWFTMGDDVVLGYLDRQIAQLKYAMSGDIPDGYLIRISSITESIEGAYALQYDFATQLVTHIAPELRDRIIGGNQ